MSFNETKNHKQYSIALKSRTGNTVGFINLSSQFIKAVIGKQEELVTVADIEAINNGDFQRFIDSLEVEVNGITHTKEKISASDY